MMNNSLFWARFLGLYAVILSIWSFVNSGHLLIYMSNLAKDPVMLMTMGVFTLPIGLAIVLSHHVFKGWATLITLLGYLIIVKAIIILFFPQTLAEIIMFWQGKNMIFAATPAFVIGLLLLYFGYCRSRNF